MSAIAGVLLVPEAGDPWGLLADGPCGARVPMTFQMPNNSLWRESGYAPEGYRLRADALVLAWDGAVVREGRHRLSDVFDDACLDPDRVGWLIPAGVPVALHEAWCLGTFAATRGLGRVVLVDADGREVPRG